MPTNMAADFRRKTRFPGADQDFSLTDVDRATDANPNRQTRFPGGADLQMISLLNKVPVSRPKPTRLPLKVNSAKLEVVSASEVTLAEEVPPVLVEDSNPWDFYTSLRRIERGGEVTAAYTRKTPVKMVAIKKMCHDYFDEFARCQHQNLLAIIRAFQFEGDLYVVTDYTCATLRQIIAIALPLEELHVSTTCRQVFDGMQHLSRFSLVHTKLDSSMVLFSSDGSVKIAHIDECQSAESASARPLGVIAVEMMQNGIPPQTEGKINLEYPEKWSAEASNFLHVTSWGTLKDVKNNRFLKPESPTIMIPFIENARWDTIEHLSLKQKI